MGGYLQRAVYKVCLCNKAAQGSPQPESEAINTTVVQIRCARESRSGVDRENADSEDKTDFFAFIMTKTAVPLQRELGEVKTSEPHCMCNRLCDDGQDGVFVSSNTH